jgi:hypothetical protein
MFIELILVSAVVVPVLLPIAVVASMGEAVAWVVGMLSIFVFVLFVTTLQFTILVSSPASVSMAVMV